jgi:hypothetical protein
MATNSSVTRDEEIEAELLRLWEGDSLLSGETVEQRKRRLRKQAEANVAQRRAAPGIAAPPPGDDASLKEWTPEPVEAGAEQHWEGVLDQAGEDADPVISGSPSSKVSTDPLVGEVADVDPEEEAVAASPAAGKIAVASQQGPPQSPGDLGPGKAEAILGILEVLGGLGGKIAGGRAMRRADKKTEQSQRVANLINALSKGRAGAQATTAQPRMGTGGQVLSALGGVGRMGGRLVDAQKKAKAEDWGRQMKEWGASTELGLAEEGLAIKRENAAAMEAAKSAKLGSLHNSDYKQGVAYGLELDIADPQLDGAIRVVMDTNPTFGAMPEHEKQNYVNQIKILYRKRKNEIEDEGEEELKARLSAARAAGDLIQQAAEDIPVTREDIEDTAKLGTSKETLLSAEIVGLYTPIFSAITEYIVPKNWEQQGDGRWKNTETGEVIGADEYKDKPAEDKIEVLLDAKGESVLQGKLLSLKLAFSNARKRKWDEEMAQRVKNHAERGPSNAQTEFIAEARVMASKVEHFEERYKALPFKGPVGSVFGGISQYLTPENFIYDDTMEAFALEMASLLNKGRPSEVDFKSAKRMMPLSSDSPKVAAAKFANLKRTVMYSELALTREIYLPIHERLRATPLNSYFEISQEELNEMNNTNLGHAHFVDKTQAKLLSEEAKEGSVFARRMIVDVTTNMGQSPPVQDVGSTIFSGHLTQNELNAYHTDDLGRTAATAVGPPSQEFGARTQEQKALILSIEESLMKAGSKEEKRPQNE